jgi:hypothetical protein
VAARLRDGRVLLVGGEPTRDPSTVEVTSAELFDPAAGRFGPAGSASIAGSHAALTLDDGRVVVAGMDNDRLALDVYEPAAGTWAAKVPSAGLTDKVRGVIDAGLLADGRLLVVALRAAAGDEAPPADPTVFEVDRGMSGVRALADLVGCPAPVSAVATASGGLAVLCTEDDAQASVRLVEPGTGATTRIALPGVGVTAGVVRLADGRLLVANGGPTVALDIADAATGSVTAAGSFEVPEDDAAIPERVTIARLGDGRVLLIAGQRAGLWDPSTLAVTPVPGPVVPLRGETATTLDDGRVLIAGGTTWPADRGLPTPPGAEIFDPAALPAR